MRIVHSCLRYPPATGGVETYVRNIVEHTRDISSNRDVRVLTSKMRTHGPITELDPNLLLDDPPYVQRLHHAATPLVSYPRLQALSYYLKHHAPNVVHGYSFWYQPADVAARFTRAQHIPFIFHPIYYESRARQKPAWQLYKKTIGRATFAAADVVVVISPHEQSLINSAGLPVKRFALIPPGIDILRFTKPADNPYAKRNISGKIIMAVGRLANNKGLDTVLEVLPDIIKKIPDIHFVIIGEDFGAASDLTKRAQQLGLRNHVHFLGHITEHELTGAYQYADLLVHPSHYEAFGIVLAEALAAGTPVVARNTAAIPYVAPHNRAGLLFKTKIELSKALLRLLQDEALRQKYGQQGQHYVQNTFTWQKTAASIIKLYDELVPVS